MRFKIHLPFLALLAIGSLLLVGCGGGSSQKSAPPAAANGQSASGTASNNSAGAASNSNATNTSKFCSDAANEAQLENQIGDSPDLTDPTTISELKQDDSDLKTMITEAPSVLTHDLRTMESVTATAAAGKDPQGESLYNDYTADVDNVNTWVQNNCSSSSDNSSSSSDNSSSANAAPPTSNSSDQSASSDQSSSGSSGSDTTQFCTDANNLTTQVGSILAGAASSGSSDHPLGTVPTNADIQQAASEAQNVANEAPSDAQADATAEAADLQGVVNGDSSAASNLITDNSGLEAWLAVNC